MRFTQWLLLSTVIASPLSWAESALDLAALQHFFQASKQLEHTSSKYPELNDDDQEFLLTGDNEFLVARLKKAGAFKEASAVVEKSGYESMDEYFDIAKRIVAAYFAVQLQQSPYSSSQDMRAMVESQKAALADNGIAPDVIEQMMAEVNEQLEQLDQIFIFAEGARPADLAVVNKHLEYVTEMLSD